MILPDGIKDGKQENTDTVLPDSSKHEKQENTSAILPDSNENGEQKNNSAVYLDNDTVKGTLTVVPTEEEHKYTFCLKLMFDAKYRNIITLWSCYHLFHQICFID